MSDDPKQVLLADDDPDRGPLLHEALSMAGLRARVQQVPGGREALRYLRRQAPYEDSPSPDLLVVDIHMPGVDGFAVLEDLRREPVAGLPVIAVSGTPSAAERRRMLDLGCRAVVAKSLGLRDFAVAIDHAARPWLGP